ncbi:hypothetical protein ACWOAQ_00955 [Helcococcus kunzii]
MVQLLKVFSWIDGEVIPLVLSMPVEARIIYDKETYLDYILEKLSFK